MTGLLSISNKRYDPPCKSKPRLIFLLRKSFSNLIKLENAIKTKNKEIKKMNAIFNFEKYNTLYFNNSIF